MCKAVVSAALGSLAFVLGGCAFTDPASNVTPTSAEFHASGSYDGSAGHLEFEYSTSAADVGTPSADQTQTEHFSSQPAGTSGTFDASVHGLQPGTIYYYAVCGADAQFPRSGGHDLCGATEQFETLPAPDWVRIDGPQVTATPSAPGDVLTFAFRGEAGQVVAPLYTDNGPVTVSVLDPSGNQLSSSNLAYTLPDDGVYTVLVQAGDSTPPISLGVYDASPLTTTENGPTVTIPIIAGEKTAVSFTGSAGDEISATAEGPESTNFYISSVPTLTLEDAAGNVVPGTQAIQVPSIFGPATLPSSGKYQLVFDSNGSTGLGSLNLYKIVNQTGTITVNGPPVTATSSAPGQTSTFSFSGTAGETVGLDFGHTTYDDAPPQSVDLLDPSGAAVPGNNYVYTLPSTGTYDIVVNSGSVGTASMSLSSPPIQTPAGTIITNGPLVDVTLPTTTSTASLTFTGSAGEQVSAGDDILTITAVGNQGNLVLLSIKDASGNVLWQNGNPIPGGVAGPATLPSDGTYTLELDANGVGSGTAALHLTTP